MSSGWGCQHLTKTDEVKEWCRLLKHRCEPGCNGCVLYGRFLFSNPETPSNRAFERRKIKKREENPLG